MNFAKTMFFTTQNKLFHEIKVFFFFFLLFFRETLQLGGGGSPVSQPVSQSASQPEPASVTSQPGSWVITPTTINDVAQENEHKKS